MCELAADTANWLTMCFLWYCRTCVHVKKWWWQSPHSPLSHQVAPMHSGKSDHQRWSDTVCRHDGVVQVTLSTNRKSYTGFQLEQKSMTLKPWVTLNISSLSVVSFMSDICTVSFWDEMWRGSERKRQSMVGWLQTAYCDMILRCYISETVQYEHSQ